jgi:hypothetical protein
MSPDHSVPFYRQMISAAAAGLQALEPETATEVRRFIASQQHACGAFSDRAGLPDAYYSLFGFFLSEAAGMKEQTSRLKNYMETNREVSVTGLVHRSCLALIAKGTGSAIPVHLKLFSSIIREFFRDMGSISSSYQYFMVFITLDAYGWNNRFSRWFIRRYFRNREHLGELPCPVVAALVVIKAALGLETSREVSRLLAFHQEGSGFRAMPGAPVADLLSTAVALTALRMAGADIRLVRPGCLLLVEENYDQGAFLAGNGDGFRDMEYTFYGLLTLGLLT